MSSATARRTGRVKFFNSQKGFGFIIPSESTEVAPVDEIVVQRPAGYHTTFLKSADLISFTVYLQQPVIIWVFATGSTSLEELKQ
ncbi:hypothetical protein BGX27_007978 [Mortierella sp. AM989]|nr:hypothetical protein BGX27_007978 [Mortierella sp. AM989]